MPLPSDSQPAWGMLIRLIVLIVITSCGVQDIDYGILRQSIQCETPREIYVSDKRLVDLLKESVLEWNRAANHMVLIVTPTLDAIKVELGGEYLTNNRVGATIWTSNKGCMEDVEEQISPHLRDIQLINVLRHEIGHVMGLSDRLDDKGLMSKNHADTKQILTIMPGTRSLLKDMYHRIRETNFKD